MIELKGRHLTLRVDLPAGVYTFYPDSGIGKTRMYEFLKSARSMYTQLGDTRYNVDGYTFNDYISHTPIEISGKNLFLFDRYNMYDNDSIREQLKHIKNEIVLIDYKGSKPFPAKRAYIDMTENSIEVHL